MTKREIAALACRILALYAAIGAFDSLASFFVNVIRAPMMPAVFGTLNFTGAVVILLPGAVRLLVAGALWFFADGLAASMIPSNDSASQKINANVDWKSLAFSTLGAFILVGAIAQLAQIVTRLLLLNQRADSLAPNYTGLSAPEIVHALVTFALGLWLFLGTRGIHSLKSIGRDSSTKPFVDETTSA